MIKILLLLRYWFNVNLRNGAVEFGVKVGHQYEDDVISFYPPDKDIEVFIDLYGGRGDEWDAPPNTSFLGGTGGKVDMADFQ